MNIPNRKDAALELADIDASVQAYRHPAELIEGEARECLVATLAEALTPIMQFVAKGRNGGTMQHRAWVWLYETRKDFVGGESIGDYAKRAGLSPARVHELVNEFRALIPAYRSPNRKSAVTRARMSAAARARQKTTGGGGKESFFGAVVGSGSAHR